MSSANSPAKLSLPQVRIFWILTFLITACGAGYYFMWEQHGRESAEAELNTIAQLKVSQVTTWRAERLANANKFMEDPLDRNSVCRWLEQSNVRSPRDVIACLESLKKNYHYSNVLLVDAVGRVRLSLQPTLGNLQGDTRSTFLESLRQRKALIGDLVMHEKNVFPHLHIIAPLFTDSGPAGRPVGAVVMVADARGFLYPLLNSWPVPSRSGETVLVRRENDHVLFLNDLRYQSDTALKYTIPLTKTKRPAVMAVLGRRGTVEGVDYRGVPVLSVLSSVPDSPWFLIIKEDKSEVFAALRQRLWTVLAGTLGLLLAVAGAFAWFWQVAQKDHYKVVAENEIARRALIGHFEHLVKYANDVILLADEQHRFVEVNDRALEMYGYTREEFLKLTLDDLTPPSGREGAARRIKRVLEKGSWVNESQHIRKDGSLVRVEVSGKAMLIEGRRFITGIVRDISDRVAAEAALRQSEERYRGLFEHMVEGFAYCRMIFEKGEPVDWIYLTVNKAFEELTGLKGIQGRRVIDAIPGIREQDPILFTTYGRVATTGKPEKIETFVKALNLWFSISLYSPAPEHFVAVFDVITQRKQAEAALRTSEEKYRRLHESMMDAFVAVDMSGRLLEWNRAFQEMLGYSAERLKNITYQELTPERWHEPEVKIVNENILPTGHSGVYEKEYYRNDGSTIPVELSTSLIKNDDGEPVLMWAIVRDISERKLAGEKIRQMNLDLEQRVKERTAQLQISNQELESFAYSVSHDLRAPLRAIDGFSQALQEECADQVGDSGRHYLDRVRAATRHMGQLIDDLLRLSRVARMEMSLVSLDLSALVLRIVEEFKMMEPERRVEVRVEPGLVIQADAGLMEIALENLLANAWKFTGKHAQARIEVGTTRQGDERVFFVRDDGAGFDMAYASKLFGVFQRLHSTAEFPGTGIGLATIRRVLQRHGGRVWGEGAVEEGSTFYFTLPEEVRQHAE